MDQYFIYKLVFTLSNKHNKYSLIQGLINIGPVIGLQEMRLCTERGPRYNPQVREVHLIKVYFHFSQVDRFGEGEVTLGCITHTKWYILIQNIR